MPDPRLLLLDEPAAGLDLGARESLVEDLATLARDAALAAIVLVSHHVEEIPAGFGHALILALGLRGRVRADRYGAGVGAALGGLRAAARRRTGRWPVRCPRGASGMSQAPPVIRPLGDAAVLVELGTEVDLAVNRRVRALADRVAAATSAVPGWGVPIPGAASLLVPVDPLDPGVGAAAARLREIVDEDAEATRKRARRREAPDGDGDGAILEIPTRYDGPDLEAVAEMTGLSPGAIVERHAATTYTTLFLGFVPGFGYLGPLPAELAVPRRPVPRTHVPAGSVAIAGAQTAVYPIDSPGGWWLIGRTETILWDPLREPPALLRPGRLVRFVPDRRRRPAMSPEAVFRVVDGGLQATIQDAGRPGLGALGVPRSGACDPMGLAVANLLVGNRPDAPVLECAIAGPELLVLRDVVVGDRRRGPRRGRPAVRAAPRSRRGPRARGRRTARPRGVGVGVGIGVRVRPTRVRGAGCRTYLAVPGGFAVPTVLGSASTSLVGGFGGLDGRPLRAGDDLLAVGPGLDDRRLAGHRWPADLPLPHPGDAAAVLAGPAAAGEAGGVALATLVGTTWRVAAASDRRGLRLEGPALELGVPSDGPSHGVPGGTIQVAPSGLPMVLLPDAGPTGGYPILAIVATADRSIVGQARPGGTIRFRLVDIDAARAAERDRRHVLEAGAARLGMTDPWDDLPDLAGA